MTSATPGGRADGSAPAPPYSAYLGAGLVAAGILLTVLVVIDVVRGRSWDDATLVLAGTLALIGTLLLLVAWSTSRRQARIWRNGDLAEATVTGVEDSSFLITGRYGEVPRSIIAYTYQDASGHTCIGKSGYVSRPIARTWRVGDKGKIRVDRHNPALSVWTGGKLTGPHAPAPAVLAPPSLVRLAKRIPSFWTGPFLFVVGLVVAGVRGGKWGPLEGLIVSLSGVVLFVAGARRIWIAHRVLRHGVQAGATVTSVRFSLLGARVTEWRYVIHYRYEDGRGHPHEAGEFLPAAEALDWKPGSQGNVRFDPQHPAHSVWVGAQETAQGAAPRTPSP